MKDKKLLIWRAGIVFLVLVILLIANSITKKNIYKNSEKNLEFIQWNKVMADSINSKKINISVDGKNYKDISLYMSESMDLLISTKQLSDIFDCSINIYNGKKVSIIKGNSKALVWLNKDKLVFDDVKYKLKTNIESRDDIVYVPSEVITQFFNYEYSWNSEENTAYFNNKAQDNNYLPTKYSYIDEKKCPEPKDQGKYGTCWAFATMAAFKSTLLPEEILDFSENNMIHNNGEDNRNIDGGNYTLSMAYLLSWKGPILAEDDEYGSESSYSNNVQKHLQEAQILPSKDYQKIKEMVFKYGGVESSMYMSMNDSSSVSVYYNSAEYAYCYTGDNKPNHDVVIVGWDDEYSKELFNDQTIEGDGAFICLNSWGSQFGDNGVFYVSYYDDCIGVNNICYTNIEEVDNYGDIYQADMAGWTGNLGFSDQDTAYFANIFTGHKNDKLSAVGFYAVADNTEYDIFVCENYENTGSLTERNHVAASGKVDNKGYYTVKLDKNYNIIKDKKFAIIVKVHSDGETESKLIPVEMNNQKLGIKTDLSDGEGYFSSKGVKWQSAEQQDCNICVKGYTKEK